VNKHFARGTRKKITFPLLNFPRSNVTQIERSDLFTPILRRMDAGDVGGDPAECFGIVVESRFLSRESARASDKNSSMLMSERLGEGASFGRKCASVVSQPLAWRKDRSLWLGQRRPLG